MGGRIAGGDKPSILSLDIYPNPNEGIFTVESVFQKPRPAKISIIYLLTNQRIVEETSSSNLTHKIQVDLPNLAPGAYAVVIETADEVKVVRMIKH